MKELKRHNLIFDSSWEYFRSTLDNANSLSSELLNVVDFRKGRFFTLLPDDAKTEKIYEFGQGEILVQNPTQEYFKAGEKASFTIIPTVNDQISEFILKNLTSQTQLSCVFDDVLSSATDKYHMDLFHAYGLHCDEEVYYLLNQKKISFDLIIECLQQSKAFWHSLCVLTEAKFNDIIEQKLETDKIREICVNAKMVIVGAYDGEGYVFWEKTSMREV